MKLRSQRLMQFLQVAGNPALAPFAKFQYIIREIAKAMDLDPDKVTNNMDEAAIQAELMKISGNTPTTTTTTWLQELIPKTQQEQVVEL